MRIHCLFSLGLAVACGGGSATGPAPNAKATPRPSARMVITIVSASIDGKKADGTPWDDASAPAPPPETGGLLAAYLAAHTELEGTAALVGEPVDVPGVLASARRSSAPDPMVFVELGGRTFRTTLAPGQFQPVWRFPIVVDVSPDSTDIVHFTVVDWDGPGQLDVIGQKLIPARELFGRGPLVDLGRFGNVAGLALEISDHAPAPDRRRVAVAARDGFMQTGVVIAAGQEVTIRAVGDVCTKGADRTRCSGPEGQPRSADTNVPGFETRAHGALLGGIGDVRFFIGRDLRFTAASSGILLLGVNDTDTSNNSGDLEVDIEVR